MKLAKCLFKWGLLVCGALRGEGCQGFAGATGQCKVEIHNCGIRFLRCSMVAGFAGLAW